MPSNRNRRIASRFAARAGDYEANAGLQRNIAERLAARLPREGVSSVLEAGCGTGLLTRRLLPLYPDASFLVTDLAPEMVAHCRERLGVAHGGPVRFAVLDGEKPDIDQAFDLVVLSMTAQWFRDPLGGLRNLAARLRPGGSLHYATIAPDCLPEWREALRASGVRAGVIDMPGLPGVTDVEAQTVSHGSGIAFLQAMRAIGADTPRAGYAPVPAGSLRRALHCLETEFGARVTWRICYGRIGADTAIT